MAHRSIRWLHDELPRLVRAGILDPAAAERLRAHYGPPAGGQRQRLLLVFGALGALLMGSGVILLLAHNWESLSRPARGALSLGLLLGAQVLVGWAAVWRRGSRAWIEGAGTLLPLALVAALALLSQTYQIGGSLEEILLYAAALSLPTVYLLGSRAAAALVAVGITSWLYAGSWSSLGPARIATLLALGAALAPFAVWLHARRAGATRTALFEAVAAVCVTLSAVRLVSDASGLWIPLFTGIMAALYALGVAGASSPGAGWRRPYHVLGALGCGVLLVVLSYREVWYEVTTLAAIRLDHLPTLLVAGIATLLVATSGVATRRMIRQGRPSRALLTAVPLVATLAWLLLPGTGQVTVVTVGINLYALAVGLVTCIESLRRGHLGVANAGLLLVVGLLALRFLDAEWSFAARGVGFIALGAVFLATNLWMVARRRVEVPS